MSDKRKLYLSDGNLDVYYSTDADLPFVSENIRDEDRDECLAVSESVEAILRYSVKESEHAWTARYFGEIVCVFGVATQVDEPSVGCPWMICTNAISRCPKQILRSAPVYLQFMEHRYSVLKNVVLASNTSAIRFIEHLGFTLGEPIEMGRRNQEFVPFKKARGYTHV